MKHILCFLLALATFPLNAQQWTTTQLSKARWWTSSVATKHFLVVGGGTTGHGEVWQSQVDIYNTLTKQWTKTCLSRPRYGAGIAAAGNKVIFVGGADELINTADILDLTTQQWTTDTLPTGAFSCCLGAGIGNKAYFMSGRTVLIYNVMTSKWSLGSKIPFDIGSETSIVSFGKKIMLKSRLEYGIYNISTDQWAHDTFSMPTPVAQTPVATPGGIWFVGGVESDGTPSRCILKYDPDEKLWHTDEMLLARAYTTAGYVKGKVIIAGGIYHYSPFKTTNLVEIYDLQSDSRSLDVITEPRCCMHYQNTAPVIGNQMFFPGGVVSENFASSALVDIYTDAAVSSTFSSKLPENTFEMSPQPCRDAVDIHFDLPMGEAATLTIFDAAGKQWIHENITTNGPPDLLLNTRLWPSGGYIIQVLTERGALSKQLLKVD